MKPACCGVHGPGNQRFFAQSVECPAVGVLEVHLWPKAGTLQRAAFRARAKRGADSFLGLQDPRPVRPDEDALEVRRTGERVVGGGEVGPDVWWEQDSWH